VAFAIVDRAVSLVAPVFLAAAGSVDCTLTFDVALLAVTYGVICAVPAVGAIRADTAVADWVTWS